MSMPEDALSIAKEADASPAGARGRRDDRIPSRAVFSAIDLGTNNCRLLIARPMRRGFRVIDAFSRIVRLGEGLGASGRLSAESMDRAVAALSVCADKIRRRQVTCMRAVATEACRAAGNCDAFVDRVRAETGINLDIISPAEEARLAVVGCQTLLDPHHTHALVFDIGGGSTELILVAREGRGRRRILHWTSMPFGVVSLAERFGCHDLPAPVYEEMTAMIGDHLAAFESRCGLSGILKKSRVQLLGTSGTVTTLASVALGLPFYDRNKVDGAWFDGPSIHALARRIALMSYKDRTGVACIGEERAEYVVAGCGILDALFQRWGFPRLRVADRGIREGVLRGLMGEDNVLGHGHQAPGAV